MGRTGQQSGEEGFRSSGGKVKVYREEKWQKGIQTEAVKAVWRDRDKNREMQQKIQEEGWQKGGWRSGEESLDQWGQKQWR